MKRVRRSLQLFIPTDSTNDRYGEQILKKSPLKKRKAETEMSNVKCKRLHSDSTDSMHAIEEEEPLKTSVTGEIHKQDRS